MDYSKLSVKELVNGIKSQNFSSEDVVRFFIQECEKKQDLNAVVEVFSDSIERAKIIDEKIKKGEKVGLLAGLPVAIKDNISFKNKKMSCASKFMKDYVSPYSATIVKKLEEQDAVIFARTNMDEFAMGGSTENSCYGACKNPYDTTRVSGGSSGGSAVVVAAGMAPVAIGTDTGGSIRQPSSFCGVVGIKPTYGTVSRYGIVAFASSTDQAGPITKNIEDNELILSVLAGKDENDATTIENDFRLDVKEKYTIGVCSQLKQYISELKTGSVFEQTIQKLKDAGHKIVDVEIPHIKDCLACYYIISPAEATSNLARFDGVKYTSRNEDAKSLEEVYVKSRSEGFGKEVKRRII